MTTISGKPPDIEHGRGVLVAGAGPVGLTAACELTRHGARVRLIELLDEPNRESRAVVVHRRTQEALAAMGVLAEFEAVACPQSALEIFAGRSAKERVRIGTDDVASRCNQGTSFCAAVTTARALISAGASVTWARSPLWSPMPPKPRQVPSWTQRANSANSTAPMTKA
jgi:hypothetical protein